jgi:hypothetical protein
VSVVLTDPEAPSAMVEALTTRGVEVRIVAGGPAATGIPRSDPTRSGS